MWLTIFLWLKNCFWDHVICWMVVIVFVTDPSGRYPSYPKKKVTYSSRIFINPSLFFAQVEPGDTVATTKEGKNFFIRRLSIDSLELLDWMYVQIGLSQPGAAIVQLVQAPTALVGRFQIRSLVDAKIFYFNNISAFLLFFPWDIFFITS